MSHALIWSELNLTDLSSETVKELPYVGFGTNYTGTWTKKLFKLKWLNTSVSDVKIWLDTAYADLYLSTEFAEIENTSNFHLINDLDFDIRITELDNFNIEELPNALAASNSNIGSSTIGSKSYLLVPSYVDGIKIDLNSNLLIKSQSNKAENGLYSVFEKQSGVNTTDIRYYVAEDILTAAKIVEIGNDSYYSYLKNYKPFEKVSFGTTDVTWVDRSTTYRLIDVVAATATTLSSAGTALSISGAKLDNKTIALNDRILVKDQTDRRQNGIYYTTKIYANDENSFVNPNLSQTTEDLFWKEALYNIAQNNPVNVQVLNGKTYGGNYFRQNLESYEVVPYSTLPTIDPDDSGNEIGGAGNTLSSNWTNATHYYNNYYVSWYYNVASGSSIGFSYDNVTNAGILSNVPTNIVNFSNVSTSTSVGQSILVNHYNKLFSGIYEVTDVGNSWTRKSDFDANSNIVPTIIQVENNKSSINSPYFYLNKSKTYDSNFILNLNEIDISETFKSYEYESVNNLITSEITNFNDINSSKFNNSGIAISQRVLVSGQATTSSQNGIYVVNQAVGSTLGLEFYSTYSIVNGAIANSSGTGTSFFLYSSLDNVSAGTTAVYFVDISSALGVTADYLVSEDKFNSTYISPEDFLTEIEDNSIILANTSNPRVNGIYQASLGTPQKLLFDYSTGYSNWGLNIFENILINSSKGTYTLSPNLRKQNDGVLLARNSGSFGDTTLANSKFGNVYVPEIDFPATNNYENFFTDFGKGSALLEELNIDWHEQDYQNFIVKAVYKTPNLSGFPISAATGVTALLSSGNLITNNDEILVYVGNGISTYSSYNGIWRTVSAGSSFYFVKHEDFDVTTLYESGTNIKIDGSPYERPTKVLIKDGYLLSGSAFGYSSVYMQGVLSYETRENTLGINSIIPNDENNYNLGQNIFIKDSEVFLSVDYSNLFLLPKISPIQHFLTGDLENNDKINGDILTVFRGYELFSTISNPLIKFYYEIGDRVLYQDAKEDIYGTNQRNYVNGIYVIVYINRTNWTYYLRKVKQNSSIGNLDHAKRLKISDGDNITQGGFHLARYIGNGTTYTWNRNNYNSFDVFTIDTNGNKTVFIEGIDYEIYPEIGYISSFGSFGTIDDTFYCYLYQDDSIPKYDKVSKPTFNRYHIVEQVLTNKFAAQSSLAKTSGTYTFDKRYFQVVNEVGNATTTSIKENTDRKIWFNEFDNNKKYFTDINHVVSVGNSDSYFNFFRQSTNGYYYSTGTALTSVYIENNLINPSTGDSIGLYQGNFYVEQVNQTNSSLSIVDWYSSLGLTSNNNVLILSDNKSSIAQTLQSSYYNDNNVLIKSNRSGKKNQKLIKFIKNTYTPVTLSYHSSFTDPISPLTVDIGISRLFLHYDPNNTDRQNSNKKWYDFESVTYYNCDAVSNSNINNLSDFGGVIGGTSISENNLILLNSQNNPRLNGIYSAKNLTKWEIIRSEDFKTNSDLRALARVSYGSRTYELILPNGPYTLGNSASDTPIIWTLASIGYTIFASAATTENYSGIALTNSIPDKIDDYSPSNNEKVFLLSQSDATQRYVARYIKKPYLTFERVGEGGSGNTALFSITNCYVKDSNRNKEYELYFDPDNTGLGLSEISWFERSFVSNYNVADFKTSNNISLTAAPYLQNQTIGSKVLVKNQSNKKENGLYFIGNNYEFYYLTRSEFLDEDSEISNTKRIKVISGLNNQGFYGLSYSLNGTPSIGNSELYWAKTFEYHNLKDCDVATLVNISLTNPPTTLDGIILESNFRVLVKDQTDKTQNGIYLIEDSVNKTWIRDNDLNNSSDVKPQLTVRVTKGDNNENKIYRIQLPLPRELSNTQLTEYILGTDNIEWISIDKDANFNTDPSTWKKIGFGTTDAFILGAKKMDIYSVAYSNRFGIAIKSPSAGRFAGLGISENGKIRNLKFKVEYKTIED